MPLGGGVTAGIAILGPMIGGLIGGLSSAGDRERGQAAAQDAMSEILALGLPPDQSGPILLKHFESAGILSPQMQQDILQQTSALANVKEDPATRRAQMEALNMIQQRAKLGLTAEDRAALNTIRTKMATDAEGKRQQILQGMHARGVGGSGAELAAQLSAAQGSAQLASSEGDALAAQASRNALAAMGQYGAQAGQVRSQDFNVNSTRAQAMDEMNRFNVKSQQATQAANVGAANDAQRFNLTNAQQISNANVGQGNQELIRQKAAQEQYYKDLAGRAQMRSNAKTNLANILSGQAAQTAQVAQTIGSGVGAAAGALYPKVKGPKKTQEELDEEDKPYNYGANADDYRNLP